MEERDWTVSVGTSGSVTPRTRRPVGEGSGHGAGEGWRGPREWSLETPGSRDPVGFTEWSLKTVGRTE